MANEIVGVHLQVEGGAEAVKTVAELREELRKAQQSAEQVGKGYGESSKQAELARDKVASITAELKSAQDAAAKIGEGVAKSDAPLKSMRQQIREAVQNLVQMQTEFGDISPEAQAAAQHVAELRDRLKDANEVAALFDPEQKFQAVVGVTQGIASGFTAAQGAMALFGGESEEVQKALLKVQAAMALSQGLSGLRASAEDFARLGGLIKNTTVFQALYNFAVKGQISAQSQATVTTVEQTAALEAQTVATVATGAATSATTIALIALRTALITTGIGALIVGIGYLISAISDWTAASETKAEQEEKINDILEKQVGIIQSNIEYNEKLRNSRNKQDNYGTAGLDTLQRELNLLKARGATSAEIFAKEQQIREQEKVNLRIQAKTWADYYAGLQAAGGLTLKMQEDLTAKINDLNKQGLDKKTEIEAAATEQAREQQKNRDSAAMAELKRQETNAVAAANLANKTQAQIFAIEDSFTRRRIGLLQNIASHTSDPAARQAVLDAVAEQQAKLKDRTTIFNKSIQDIQNQLRDEEFAAKRNAEEKEQRELSLRFAERIKTYQNAGKDTTELVTAFEKEQLAITKKYAIDNRKVHEEASAEELQSLTSHIEEISGLNYDNNKAVLDNVKSTEEQKLTAEISNNTQRLAELGRFHEQVLTDTTLNASDRFAALKLYDDKRTALETANSNARKDLAKAERETRVKELQAVSGALDGFAELAGEQTAAGKAFAVTSATISAILGAQQVFTALSSIPIVGPELGALAAAGALAAGFNNVRKILAVQVPGQSSASSAGSGALTGGSAPLTPAGATSQPVQLDQNSLNAAGNATIVKAIVVESDVTSSQQRIQRIQQAATFK